MKFNIIKDIVSSKPPTFIKPRGFFIAWQGVPTLAYQGFSNILLQIKQEIQAAVPSLCDENPGSLWPKTSLGALKDNKFLDWQHAVKLRNICTAFNEKVEKASAVFKISQLSVVLFQCRSLEKRLVTFRISLNGPPLYYEDFIPDSHQAMTDQIMRQFDRGRLSEYLKDLNREGNRESDYRKDFIEAALVFELPKNQPQYIQDFINAVQSELPDCYCWFDPESRHITLRSLA